MNQHFAGVQNMPENNNQKGPSAAARLAKLPMIHLACSKLLVLYADTKCGCPNLKSVCEVLENKVAALGTAACDRVSPMMARLGPQISIANDVACKGLDWLETRFPVLHTPTEQVVATAKNKMHKLQDAVSIAAIGTMGCVQHTVTLVRERMQEVDEGTNQSLVKRAISVGLDSTLNMSEALVDQVLPPTEEEKEEAAAAHVVGLEAATLRGYSVRLISLAAKLYRRSCHTVWAKMQSVQVCCYDDFVQVFISGSGPPDYLFDLGLEHPGFAPVSAASGCVCILLYLTDVQLALPTIRRKPLQSSYSSEHSRFLISQGCDRSAPSGYSTLSTEAYEDVCI